MQNGTISTTIFDSNKENYPFSKEDIERKVQLLESIISLLNKNEGRLICCNEYLSHVRKEGLTIHPNNISYDRHSCCSSTFYMKVKWAGVRISGGMLMVYNEKESLEVDTGSIFYGECGESSFSTIERLGSKHTRTVEVKIVDKKNETANHTCSPANNCL